LVAVDRLALDEDQRDLVRVVQVLAQRRERELRASSIRRRISSSISPAISSE
jgi:hypothetical protein